MLSSIAKRIHAMTNHCVVPVDARWRAYWDDVWNGLPYLWRPESMEELHHADGQHYIALRNGPSVRQYYSGMQENRILWRKWDGAPGEIRLTPHERHFAASALPTQKPFVVVEPNFKTSGGGGQNKDWGWENWRRAILSIDDVAVPVQVGPRDTKILDGAHHIVTQSFRHACAILERSIGYVGHEGGLHHAAAALGKPAVVVFGGYISPEVTGYDFHTNLYVPSAEYPLGCGYVTPCQHCRDSMSKITVESVVNAVREMVDEQKVS